MSDRKPKNGGGRGHRWPGRGNGPRKTAGPTAPRLIAIRVVERVQRAGAYADLALHHALVQSRMPAADRGLATELVYGTLRWRGRLDYLISRALDKDLGKLEPLVTSALRVGTYQIFFSDRIPDNAAVDEAVRCVRALGIERATGLVNAVLRRLSREGKSYTLPTLEDDALGHLVHACSLPEWLAKRWLDQYGAEDAAELAQVMNEPAPLTVRANRTRTTRDELLKDLLARYPDAKICRYAPDGLVLGRKGDVGQDPRLLAGDMSVQDEASQLIGNTDSCRFPNARMSEQRFFNFSCRDGPAGGDDDVIGAPAVTRTEPPGVRTRATPPARSESSAHASVLLKI